MTKTSLFLTALATLTATSVFAQPGDTTSNCVQTINGRTVEASATLSNGEYHASMKVDGQDVPLFGSKCFRSNRPGNRFVLCSFRSKDFRIDLYPWVETTSGAVKSMQYVIWNGATPSLPNEFSSCSN